MKYLIAVGVCAAEITAFALMCALVLRVRPGALLYILFIAIVLFPTWKVLTRKRGSGRSHSGASNPNGDGHSESTSKAN